MDVRTLAIALVAGLNAMVEKLEEAISADGDQEEPEEKPARRSRSSRKDEDDEPEEKEERKPRRSRSKDKDEDADDDKDDDDDDADSDAPSEDDIVDAVRAAQKVLEKDDVVAVIRKYGKCDRASQVPEDRRQKVIDALEKAIDDAK